jgi:hypothetical protein
MSDPISYVGITKNSWDTIKALVKLFWPTNLHLVRIEQRQWIGGVLVHSYTFRVEKPFFSHSASRKPIQMGIPAELDIADFRVFLPEIKTDPVSIPPSALLISAQDLIGDYLGTVRNGQEIKVDLRIKYPQQDVIDISEDRKENYKAIRIRNPHAFPVRSCDIERPLALNEIIDEIQIVKSGDVVSTYRLFKLQKTSSLEFQGGDLKTFFPNGIAVSADDWLSNTRTEKRNCILKFTTDLGPEDEIEIRFIYRM